MATEQHYLLALSNTEREFLQQIVSSKHVDTAGERHEKLMDLLVRLPYPTIQILERAFEGQRSSLNASVALGRLLAHSREEQQASLPLINFLANFPLCLLKSSTFREQLIAELSAQLAAGCERNDEIYMALLGRIECRPVPSVLAQLNMGGTTTWWLQAALPNKECALAKALQDKQHFVMGICEQLRWSLAPTIADTGLRNNLLVLKFANEFWHTAQKLSELGDIGKGLAYFEPDASPQELLEMHHYFYADVQRLSAILSFLKKYPEALKSISVGALLQTSSILDLLLKHKIKTSYDDTRRIVDSSYQWQQKMNTGGAKSVHNLELETLVYYTALALILDVVLVDNNVDGSQEQYYAAKMQQLNGLLRQVRNLDTLCSLLEDIFHLVFLRWEHVRAENWSAGENAAGRRLRVSDSFGSEPMFSDTTPRHVAAAFNGQTTRHGFACRGLALHRIFTLLRNIVTRRCHSEDYKHASERLQLRFQRIVDIISEALWKYSVLEKIDESLTRSGAQQTQQHKLSPDELLQLVQLHADAAERSSSDDDSRDRTRCNYLSLTRRKVVPKKRRRATISGALATAPDTASSTVVPSLAVTPVETAAAPQWKVRDLALRFSDRSIIPKMLGSPENLAIMALALNNLEDVKYIIETFNLQNSELQRELLFVEQQHLVKQKLAAIYANYEQQEQSSQRDGQRPKATVEQIKQVAAKGFEVSKLISVVDNFAKMQRVQQTPAVRSMLQRYMPHAQYGFLRQFDERNLNAVIVCDLILNLPLKREITASLLLVIKRQQQIASGIVSTAATSFGQHRDENAAAKAQLPRDVGSMPLLENLSECLRLLPECTLPALLRDNYHSLKPRKLAVELQRQRAFDAVFYKPLAELARCDDLRVHAPLFQRLLSPCNYYARFTAYVAQLAKLVELRDPQQEYHTGELLKIDAYALIGELLFERDLTALELEGHVCALNLNLLHVIALNLCPEMSPDRQLSASRRTLLTPEKQQTIVNYVANQNSLLAHLLQNINNNGDTPTQQEQGSICSTYLRNMLRLSLMESLAPLYGGNRFIAVLLSDSLPLASLQHHLVSNKLQQQELLQQQVGNRSSAVTALETRESDRLIIELIAEDGKNVDLAGRLCDIGMRARLIHENFTKISTTRLAKELIEYTLHHRRAHVEIAVELRAQLEATLADITIYAQVSEVLQFETWPQAYNFGLKTPNMIFQRLLQLRLFKLCYEWCRVVQLADRFATQRHLFLDVLAGALLQLNDETDDSEIQPLAPASITATPATAAVHSYLLRILETFPIEDAVVFLDAHKDKFRSLPLLTYTIDFLSQHNNRKSNDNYKNYRVSLAIFKQLTRAERDACWQLLRVPLLIVEQLVMNAKFELLAKVLTAVRSVLAAQPQPEPVCPYCFDKRGGNIYNIHEPKASSSATSAERGSGGRVAQFQLSGTKARTTGSAFMLLNFNLYQQDHSISNECIDLLMRIYATKALDYHIPEAQSSWEQISQITDTQQSLDSLWDVFQMPRVAPARDEWVCDDEATHCMCCRRAKFTMLMRRHHCRRCGRVVCFACSTNRMRIPEFYADVEVRICNDCQRNLEEATQSREERSGNGRHESEYAERNDGKTADLSLRWKLSGNITHDKVLREEFCYEHAPSVALCLSILGYHIGQPKCIDLLLYHCRQLEKLIVPHPEIDVELVAKMMNCLALAAKVRGGNAEIETLREHSEIIIAVVQHGCESLIPPGPLSLDTLADALMQAEKWSLALEVHLKCGFPTAGLMAAHGLSCLRAGCFDTAREKFSHCMTKLSNELINSKILPLLLNPHGTTITAAEAALLRPKRPQRGPPLLQEILKLIEATMLNVPPQEETLKRASILRNSNTSLATLLARHPKEQHFTAPLHEPAMNIINTLANLKSIAKGQYDKPTTANTTTLPLGGSQLRQSTTAAPRRDFEECLHYLLTYGSHADLLRFLMQRQQLAAALKYVRLQNLDADLFIQHIYLDALRSGRVPQLIDCIVEFDPCLVSWRQTLMQTCRYLETQQLLHSLYQLQLLLKDPVRASMTCVRFYSMHCDNFQKLHAHAEHLHNAHLHLQSELEIAQWENINMDGDNPKARNKRKNSAGSRRSSTASVTSTAAPDFLMQMDARSLNGHISTILRQLEVAKFLAQCERASSATGDVPPITEQLLKQMRPESGKCSLPTLFDTPQDKIQICILLLMCGKNIEEGFGLTYRIIDAYKLPPMKVFGATAKYLARTQRLGEVEKLLNCINSGNNNGGSDKHDIDEILSIAINAASNSHEPEVRNRLDSLAQRIHSIELRISSHIFIGQLKSAYLLANKHERLGDIRRILRQAELSNQTHIKKLCEKKLSMTASGSMSTSAHSMASGSGGDNGNFANL